MKLRTSILLLMAVGFSQAAILRVEPLIPALITNVSLGNYDVQGTGAGQSVFRIHVSRTSADTGGVFRVLYRIYVSTIQTGGVPRAIYEGRSNEFRLGSDAPAEIVVSSKDFMVKNNPAVWFSRSVSLTGGGVVDLQYQQTILNQTLSAGGLVSGEIRWEVVLQNSPDRRSWSPVGTESIVAQVLSVTEVRPLVPGVEPGSGFVPEVADPYPQFQWSSDLPNGVYAGMDQYELQVFRQLPGRSLQESLLRPYWTGRVSSNSTRYPVGAPALQPGETYFWRVRTFLQGNVNSELLSDVREFRVRPSSSGTLRDPRVAALLRSLMARFRGTPAESALQGIESFDSDLRIELDGQVYGMDQMDQLLQALQSSDFTVETVRVR